MKAGILIIFLGTWGVQLFFPWWSLVIPCFIAGLFGPDRGIKAFFAGFLGVGLLWLVLALFADWQNDFILSGKMAELLKMPATWGLYAITILSGAITGGLACLSGYLILGRGR